MNRLKRLHFWMMDQAKHPQSVKILGFLSFCESIFFPIPIDPFLLALGVARPKRAIILSLIVTVFSVLGAFLGYAIGYFFWEQSQNFFYTYVFSESKVQSIFESIQTQGFWALFFSGFTPLPYKVFTLASGVIQMNIFPFFLGSLAGRALRFMPLGILLYIFGERIRFFIEKHFEKACLLVGLSLLLVLILLYFFFKTLKSRNFLK